MRGEGEGVVDTIGHETVVLAGGGVSRGNMAMKAEACKRHAQVLDQMADERSSMEHTGKTEMPVSQCRVGTSAPRGAWHEVQDGCGAVTKGRGMLGLVAARAAAAMQAAETTGRRWLVLPGK